jgi:hypothetical protein
VPNAESKPGIKTPRRKECRDKLKFITSYEFNLAPQVDSS